MQTLPIVACCEPVQSAVLSEAEADELAAGFRVLADPVRLRLLSIIAASPTGEVCTCDMPEAVDRSQPTVSHHLKILVDAGLLDRDQRGKWAWFRLNPDRLEVLRSALA